MAAKSSKKKTKSKIERKKEYMEAAAYILEQKGFAATTIKDITTRAQTSVGNFYIYFSSKEQVFEEILAQFHQQFLDKLQSLKLTGNITFHSISALIKVLVSTFQSNRTIGLIFLKQMEGMNEKFAKIRSDYQLEIVREVESVLSVIPKEFLNPLLNIHVTAYAWVGTILEIIGAWLQEEISLSIDELVKIITGFLIWGTANTKK